MDINEAVKIGKEVAGRDSCPFDHKKKPVVKKKNVFPPAGGKYLNDSTTLAKNLAKGDYHWTQKIDITTKGKKEKFQYSAHHLISVNESWPKTKLKKWVDKKHGHIKENIGYDVNALENGVSLPGFTGIKYGTFGKGWGGYGFQREYAFAAMDYTMPSCQFHDRHAAYSKFVVKVLDKVSEKLDAKVRAKNRQAAERKIAQERRQLRRNLTLLFT